MGGYTHSPFKRPWMPKDQPFEEIDNKNHKIIYEILNAMNSCLWLNKSNARRMNFGFASSLAHIQAACKSRISAIIFMKMYNKALQCKKRQNVLDELAFAKRADANVTRAVSNFVEVYDFVLCADF